MSSIKDFQNTSFITGIIKSIDKDGKIFLVSSNQKNHTAILLITSIVIILLSIAYMFFNYLKELFISFPFWFVLTAIFISNVLFYLLRKIYFMDIFSGRGILLDDKDNKIIFLDNYRKGSIAFEIFRRNILSLHFTKIENELDPGKFTYNIELFLDKNRIIIAENNPKNSIEISLIEEFIDPIFDQ
jgi:hypothetical protein